MKLGRKTWTKLTRKPVDCIAQILFHQGKLYVLHRNGQLFAFDCLWGLNNGDRCDFETCHIIKASKNYAEKNLVESARGDLLMIVTRWSSYDRPISMYKLVISCNDAYGKMEGDWIGINRIGNGDEVLLMSFRHVIFMLASKCVGLQPNSAYTIISGHNGNGRYVDIRMFTLDTSELQQGESIELGVGSKEIIETSLRPFWINPTSQ